MKTKLLLTFFLCSLYISGQTVVKLDSIHQYSWDDVMMDWSFDTRDLYSYDNGGSKETNILRLNWTGTDWQNFYQFNKDYNSNNDLIQNIQQNWDNSGMTWMDGTRESYTYNMDNLVSNYVYAIWNGATWMDFNDNQYTYDISGNVIEDIRRDLNFATMMLENTQRRTYNYSGGLLQDEVYEEWQVPLNDWENVERTDYSYDGNNNVEQIDFRSWQTVSMDWSDPYQRSIYTYDPGDLLIEVLEQTYGSGSWNNTNRALNTYSSGNLTEVLIQEWNSGMSVWDNNSRQLRSYDGDDNEIELIYESWDDVGSAWEGFLRLVKFWSPEDALGVSIVDLGSVKAYPNPVSSLLSVSLPSESASDTRVSLFGLNGQQIVDFTIRSGDLTGEMQLNYLSPGPYYLRINNTDGQKILKIIKD